MFKEKGYLILKGKPERGGTPLPISRLFIIRKVRRNAAQNTSLMVSVTYPNFTYSVAVNHYRTNDGRPPSQGTTMLFLGVSGIGHFTEQYKRTIFGHCRTLGAPTTHKPRTSHGKNPRAGLEASSVASSARILRARNKKIDKNRIK